MKWNKGRKDISRNVKSYSPWKGNRRVTQVYNAIAEGRLLSKSKERKSSVKISRRLPNNVFILKDIGPVEVTGRDEEVSTYYVIFTSCLLSLIKCSTFHLFTWILTKKFNDGFGKLPFVQMYLTISHHNLFSYPGAVIFSLGGGRIFW